MNEKHSIAEARNHLSELVQRAETGEPVTLTRRGRAVAVLVSHHQFQNLQGARQPGFWDAFQGFTAQHASAQFERDAFATLRDRDPGRPTQP